MLQRQARARQHQAGEAFGDGDREARADADASAGRDARALGRVQVEARVRVVAAGRQRRLLAEPYEAKLLHAGKRRRWCNLRTGPPKRRSEAGLRASLKPVRRDPPREPRSAPSASARSASSGSQKPLLSGVALGHRGRDRPRLLRRVLPVDGEVPEPLDESGRKESADENAVRPIFTLEVASDLVELSKPLTIAEGYEQLDFGESLPDALGDPRAQLVQALPGLRPRPGSRPGGAGAAPRAPPRPAGRSCSSPAAAASPLRRSPPAPRRRPRSRPAARSSGSDPSTTCTIRSASTVSSSVALKASTSSCGSLRMKPTVSVSRKRRPSCSKALVVGSSVWKSRSPTPTPAPVSAFSRVDLPAFV